MVVPLKIGFNFSRFKPALNWNQFLADSSNGSNSLNSDTELIWGFKVRLENKNLRQRLDSFIAKFFTINIYLEFYDKKYNNLSRQCKVLGTDPKLDIFHKSLW